MLTAQIISTSTVASMGYQCAKLDLSVPHLTSVASIGLGAALQSNKLEKEVFFTRYDSINS